MRVTECLTRDTSRVVHTITGPYWPTGHRLAVQAWLDAHPGHYARLKSGHKRLTVCETTPPPRSPFKAGQRVFMYGGLNNECSIPVIVEYVGRDGVYVRPESGILEGCCVLVGQDQLFKGEPQ